MKILFRRIVPVTFFILYFFSWSGCTSDKGEEQLILVLENPASYPGEDWPAVQKGLAWSLSFLGAALPPGSLNKVFVRDGNNRLIFDPRAAGFSDEALQALVEIGNAIRETEEYKLKGAVDMGRFLMMTVYSSYHYYAITGAEQTLAGFKNRYSGINDLQFVAINSGISKGDRKITFHIDPDISRMYFIAEEGTGSVADGTFMTKGYEVISILPNGQPRFILYDENGKLKDASDTSRSIAGKPGKCMWCHESNIQPLFTVNDPVPGYLTPEEFVAYVDTARMYLDQYRNAIPSEINYHQLQDHAWSEHLYTGFMEPAVFRISQEWGLDTNEVMSRLQGLPVHSNPEFPFASGLYDRMSVEMKAPFRSIRVPSSAREKSAYEPDLFGLHH